MTKIKVNDIIWAKLRGYPWWPAQIVSQERLPKAIKSTENDSIPVFFFGSRDYALINKEFIKEFSEENWKTFRTKCSAPKFKSALAEARKKLSVDYSSSNSNENENKMIKVIKKRGRPKKLRLLENRKRLQKLFFSHDKTCLEEIFTILETINEANELESNEIEQTKLGNLLKIIFCSNEHEFWHTNEKLLKLVQRVAIRITKK